MLKRAPWMLVAIAIAGSILYWLLTRGEGATLSPDGGIAAAPSSQLTAEMRSVDASSGAPTRDGDVAQRAQVETVDAPLSAEPADDAAVMSGRCVDEQGLPLAGVTVELHGWVGNSERLAAHRRDHGEVVWEDPEEVLTQHDGRFEVCFFPPPPYQFTLRFDHPDRVPMGGRWGNIAPGTSKDFGDIVLAHGVSVSGRVVDVDGVPLEGVEVRLDRYNRPDRWRDEIKPRESAQTRTAADGSFRMSKPLTPAIWNLDLRNARLVEPLEEVEVAGPATALELIVKRAADVERIRGLVVDEVGQPVRGARIEPVGRMGGGWMTNSKRDGTFELRRNEAGDPDGPFPLSVEHDGCEFLTTEERYDWGAEGVRLVVRKGIDVHVHVTRADDGSAVESFALRAMPKPGSTGRWSSSYTRVRGSWEHEGGRAIAEGLRRGPNVIVVEPPRDSGLMTSPAIEVDVRDGMATTVAVQLEPCVELEARVSRADGSPVVGSKVELIEVAPDEELLLDSNVAAPGDWGWTGRVPSTLVGEGTTDAGGDCVLLCAASREYSLRVTGVGHAPVIRNGVRAGDGVVEVVLPLGGAVVVTLTPPALVGDLRELAMLSREGVVGERETRMLPGIRLTRQVGDRREEFPLAARSVAFDDQGRATIEGVPAGTWDLQLMVTVANGGAGFGVSPETVRAGLVFEEGEELQVALDLSEMRTGRVEGTVMLNGEPFSGAVQLEGQCGLLVDGTARRQNRYTKTDERGNFELPVLPGTWRADAWITQGDHGFYARATGAFAVVSGQTARVAIEVPLVTARVRLLSPSGQPVAGARLSFERDGAPLGALGEPTDAEGYTKLTTTAGTAIPRVWIRSLQSQESQREFWRANHADPTAIERAQVSLAPVEFRGGDAVIELRLRGDWDR